MLSRMYTDGASSGNPGPAGIGIVIIRNSERLTYSAFIGRKTNNVAEYEAFLKGLKLARCLEISDLEVLLDSELVVRQLEGKYKVRNENLLRLYKKAKNLIQSFNTIKIIHISREENTEADRLAREAIRRNEPRGDNPR